MADGLLNQISYYLSVLAWQNSKDASCKPPRNVPVFKPLPGVDKEEKKPRNPDEASMDISDMKAFLSKPRVSGK